MNIVPVVPEEGLEPSRPGGHNAPSEARLPFRHSGTRPPHHSVGRFLLRLRGDGYLCASACSSRIHMIGLPHRPRQIAPSR